jgi:TRAP-type C4-dicarboxylate transport system permease small subunit
MNRLYRTIRSISDAVNRVVEWSLFSIGAAMALVVALQVFFRYVLNNSLFWSEELGRMFLVWLTFLGATVAYKRKAHVGVDLLAASVPGPVRRVLRVTVAAGSLLFFWFIAFHGFEFFQFIHGQKTASLGFSRRVPFVMIPVSGCILLLHGLISLMDGFKKEPRS